MAELLKLGRATTNGGAKKVPPPPPPRKDMPRNRETPEERKARLANLNASLIGAQEQTCPYYGPVRLRVLTKY